MLSWCLYTCNLGTGPDYHMGLVESPRSLPAQHSAQESESKLLTHELQLSRAYLSEHLRENMEVPLSPVLCSWVQSL